MDFKTIVVAFLFRDVHAAERSDRLSLVLYQHGGASYLQVLTNETNYFSAELNLVQAQLNERLALVELYQALGGGRQQ
jgi:outer membrane protein, multidrug efflux system